MKKVSDVLLIIGIIIIIAGIIGGIAVGLLFNFVIAIPVWLLSIIAGGGCASVSGSITEAEQDKADDMQLLQEIIEKVKRETP